MTRSFVWLILNHQKTKKFQQNLIKLKKMTDPRHRLEDLIQTLCTTGADNLDEVTLKDIKTVCRYIL